MTNLDLLQQRRGRASTDDPSAPWREYIESHVAQEIAAEVAGERGGRLSRLGPAGALGVTFLGEARAATVAFELTDVPGDAEGSVAQTSACIE